MAEITFLGTGHGDPSLTRFCSSLHLNFCGLNFLVDAGPPVLALMIRNGVCAADLAAVFITHMHEDHTGGLTELLKNRIKYPQTVPPAFFLPEADAVKPLLGWMQAMHIPEENLSRFRFECEEPGKVYHFGEAEVRFHPTRHLAHIGFPSNAVSFSGEGKRVIFTGDLTEDYSDFPLNAGNEEYDLCVAEATHAVHHPEKIFEKLCQAPAKRIILNHIGAYWTDGQEHVLEKLAEEYRCPVEIAFDGMKVSV